MRYLIDTQIWLWMLVDPEQLGSDIIGLLTSEENQICVSIASYWELQIKANLGRVTLPADMISATSGEGISIVEISVQQIEALRYLPLIHRDPFDRIILATSIIEKIPLISADSELLAYRGVQGLEIISA